MKLVKGWPPKSITLQDVRKLWVVPKAFPDKASHPNFPHMRNMRINPGMMLQNTGNMAETQPKKLKMQTMRTISARDYAQKRRTGRVALSGMALGDMESKSFKPKHVGAPMDVCLSAVSWTHWDRISPDVWATIMPHFRFSKVVGPVVCGPKRVLLDSHPDNGGHLKPVTLKPISRIFRILASVFSAFSAFSASSLRAISSDPCFFSGVRGTFRIFRILPVSGSNRWKIRPTGFIMTGLRFPP